MPRARAVQFLCRRPFSAVPPGLVVYPAVPRLESLGYSRVSLRDISKKLDARFSFHASFAQCELRSESFSVEDHPIEHIQLCPINWDGDLVRAGRTGHVEPCAEKAVG